MCVHEILIVPSALDAAIMPFERQRLVMKLDMEKKHPKLFCTTSIWIIALKAHSQV